MFPAEIRVFGPGDPPPFLFSIPEWEARDRIKAGEATVIRTSKRVRGIRLLKRSESFDQHQIKINGGLATLEQVQGLPCAGPAIRIFYGKKKARIECIPTDQKKAA